MKKERSFCISMLLGKSTKYQKPKWKQPEKALNKFLMQSSLKFNDRNGYRHIEFLLKEDGSHMEKLGQPSLETSIKRAWKVKVKSLSHFQLFMTIWTVALHPLPSTGLSRQEYWSELPFSSPGDLLWSRDWTRVFHIVDRRFTVSSTREVTLVIEKDYY